MPELLFEIWRDDDSHGHFMSRVDPQNDKVRLATCPKAVLVHSFTARSGFEAFRKNNAWHGYGPWTPPDDFEDQFFTEEEAAQQRAYLFKRHPD